MDLKLDPINTRYFELLRKKRSKPIKLAETDAISNSDTLAYSTAISPKTLLDYLPTTRYENLKESELLEFAKETTLVRRKMYAGIGSSIERKTHLMKHVPERKGELGAKATDLFFKIGDKRLSFAEAQILQGIRAVERKEYAKVVFEDLVSDETEGAVERVWDLKYSESSYGAFVKSSPILERTKSVVQANLPTLTPDGKTSFNRVAPGGHGFFGFEMILQILNTRRSSVAFISNGEDLAACPDPATVGWVVKENIPLCMVVTEKTEIDKKGGQLAVVAEKGSPKYVTLIETAQAKAGGQLNLFEELGLTVSKNSQSAYFNTNLALFNETILRERLVQLRDKVGEAKFFDAIAPDLIENWKEQTDKDGVKRKYLQLEGAMGSVYLNLDKLSREETGKPLVHFLLVSRNDRTKFFTPIKTAYDLYLQYYSGEYGWDPVRFCPIQKKSGQIPVVLAESDDVETVLTKFTRK